MPEVTEQSKFENVVKNIEAEMTVNAELIKLIAAGDYLLQLIEPGMRAHFEELLRDVSGVEEVKKVLELIKRQIGQQAAKRLFGL